MSELVSQKRRWPRSLMLGGAMAGGMVIGAAGLAGAAMVGQHMGWHHGPRLERIQGFVRTALDSVGATSDQEAKVHDIVASAFTDLTPKPEDQAAFRKQAIELLRAPTIDKAALEKLRTDFVARADAKSKRILDAVEQIADVLTPDERAKLADRAASMAMMHGPMDGGGWHRHDGDHSGRDHRPDDAGHGNQGPSGDTQDQGDH